MGPFIPSITLTDPDEVTIPLIINEIADIDDDGVHGELGFAITSKGRPVGVWKGHPNNLVCFKFCCHGFSLGTYLKFGYSVCNGDDILTALEDDYVEIVADQTPSETIQLLKVGDIVSFAELSGEIIHTAKVFCLDINPSVPLRPIKLADIILATKNGYYAACQQPILTILSTYPKSRIIRFWRDKLTCFDDTMQQ